MPNRYLRAGYIDSKRINALSADAERTFCRLLVHVDDFGRCEADVDLLRGKLFARQITKVTESKVRSWIEELAANDLLYLYDCDGTHYIQMQRWERGRAKHSKCPDPPTSANICLHMYADANKSPDSDTDTDTDTDSDTDKRTAVLSLGEFANVMLTEQEYNRLCDKHGKQRADAGIETLGAWMKSTGKRRKDHYASLNASSWVWDKVATKMPEEKQEFVSRFK